MLEELGQPRIPTIRDQALNERDYGDLSGLNKDDARKQMGRGAGAHLAPLLRRRRRPAAKACKDTAARVLPYYIQEILPRVLRGERVLVAAHGNSLRALVMVLDRLTPEARSSSANSRPACRWSTGSTPTRRWRSIRSWRRNT